MHVTLKSVEQVLYEIIWIINAKNIHIEYKTRNRKCLLFKKILMIMVNGGNLLDVGFSKEACRIAYIEMIIIDELPFRHMEGEGFRNFCRV